MTFWAYLKEKQMSKIILSGESAKKALKNGIEAVANAVKITLGPKGRNVVLDRKYVSPLITNDGVSIAKEIELFDPFENMGAGLIKEVSVKTNDDAGDGTTTACILAESMVKEGLKNIASGASPILVRTGMEKAKDIVVKKLKEISKPVSSELEISQIASISAGNEEIGAMVADAFSKVGKDGVITIEESKTSQTKLKVTQGLEFEKGYISPYMAPQDTNICVLENPFILVTDKKLTNINELLPLFEALMKTARPLLIIAEDIDGEVLSTIVLNNIRGSFNSVAVKCPSFGNKQKDYLEDIALLTSATYISKDIPFDFKQISLDNLGEASLVKVTKDKTTIIGGKANIEIVNEKRELLKSMLIEELELHEKIHIEDRLARLSGGVAVIEVGAPTEIEMREKKLRIEDALSATKSATKEGIVMGGGCALLKCENELINLISVLSGDEQTGAKIILKSLEAPLRQIAKNAGRDDGVIVEKVKANINKNIGYNALTDTFEDMFDSGIIDPTKVTRSALENACSVASSILTTEVLIADKQEAK